MSERKKRDCARCKSTEHMTRACTEKRLQKLWPGEYVFRGKIRTPGGSFVELEMSLGERGESLMRELVKIAAGDQ